MGRLTNFRPIEPPPIRIEWDDPIWHRWLDSLYKLQTNIQIYTETFDPGTVTANTTIEYDVTVTGVLSTSYVLSVTKPTHSAGMGIVNWRVKADDTVSITFMNSTGAGVSPGSETYIIIVLEQ